jgi:hypothetical protein
MVAGFPKNNPMFCGRFAGPNGSRRGDRRSLRASISVRPMNGYRITVVELESALPVPHFRFERR